MSISVYSKNILVAQIHKPSRTSDGYRPEEPWLLIRKTGRVDRFATLKEAKEESVKSFSSVKFKKD